jgi:hypothetical protein
VLELTIALALSSLVVFSAVGITAIIARSDRVTSRYMNDTTNLSQTQFVVRRALQNLIAAKPLPPPTEDGEVEGDEDEEGDDSADPNENEGGIDSETQAIIDSLFGGVDDSLPIEAAIPDTSKPPNFELYFERVMFPPTGEEIYLPRFEVVTSIWPVPRSSVPIDLIDDPDVRRQELEARIRGTVRGVFELLYLEDGFALAYTPIEPSGPSYILGRGFEDLIWEIMPSGEDAEGWQQIGAAYLEDQFPDAVRLRLRTSTGTTADWLFETIVLTEGQ